jgi:hypothetical protein
MVSGDVQIAYSQGLVSTAARLCTGAAA